MFENKRLQRSFFAAVATITLLAAILGTVATLYFLSATPTGERLRTRLGLNELKAFNITNTRSERIIVEESSAIIDASKKAGLSVVSITSTGRAVRDVFGMGVIQAPQSAGTGFIVTSDGLIATNKHVIADAQSVTVTTADNRSFNGKVVAKDPSNDLALIKVEASGLPVADLGDSDRVEVGQWVIAIGNALGELQNSVTVGVVSAKDRTTTAEDSNGSSETLFGMFQTDAAINLGNSGGPLLTLGGQVIGINTATSTSAQSIGFALPVNELKKDLETYRKVGKILQPYLGVRSQTLTKAIAKTFNLPVEKGAWLSAPNSTAILANSPAAKAGLKDGDIITKVNNDEVTEGKPLVRLLRKFNPGDKVTLTVLRNGSTLKIDVTLGQLD